MKAFFPLLPLILQITVSCSQMPQKAPEKMSDLAPEQLEKLNEEALVLASQRLEQMVEGVKNNPESSSYLASDLFLKANMSLLEGDFVTAATLFKYVSQLAPQDAFVQKKYAISLIRMGDFEEAETVLEKLYQKSSEEKVGMILAGVYAGTDQDKKARLLYQELLAKNPRNEDACVFLGKAFIVNKELSQAKTQFNKCAKDNPKSGIYDYYLGKMSVDQGNLDQAIGHFMRAKNKQPSLTGATVALGVIYEEREQYTLASNLYVEHLKKFPSDSVILGRIVQVLFLKESYQEVIPYAEKLSDLEPENLNLKVKLGVLYTDAKRYSEAIAVFKDLLTMAPESDKILYYLGAIYQEMKSYNESIEYFNQIPTTSGLYTDSSVQMASMLSTLAQAEFLGRNGESWQKQFLSFIGKKFEEHKELRVEFSVIKAGFYEAVGQFKSAMEVLMLVQDEKNFSTQHKYYLAGLYEKEKRYDESTSLIMGILEKEPQNAHAWNFLGYSMLLREGDMDRAFEYIQTAFKINPDDGYIRDSLGWYYFKKGETQKALDQLKFAHAKIPDDVEILKHLAIIYVHLGDFKKAKVYLESALKHVRLPHDRQEILASMEQMEKDRIPASGNLD